MSLSRLAGSDGILSSCSRGTKGNGGNVPLKVPSSYYIPELLDLVSDGKSLKAVSAVGFGSRQRHITGDQYDNFSIDFKMENDIHMHSMSHQIDGRVNTGKREIKRECL